MGYHRAGLDVVGVDREWQKNYPFWFVQADAIEYLKRYGHLYDAVAGSPPCQKYSVMRRGRWQDREHEDFIETMRAACLALGKPYVIENVVGAPLISPLMLCGSMFGLQTKLGSQLRRHRLFECPWLTDRPKMECRHNPASSVIGVYGGGQHPQRRRPATIGVYGSSGGSSGRDNLGLTCFTVEARRQAMGIDWMSGSELSQAIPPAYTEFIGKLLLDTLNARVVE